MTRLLVSVRDEVEAQDAVAGGADIIDVKEPLAGSLGAASWSTWHAVAQSLDDRHLLSAALGELSDYLETEAAIPCRPLPPRFQLAKMGLAGCAGRDSWSEKLDEVHDKIAPQAQPVAVVYADWRMANSPPPEDVLDWAKTSRCQWVLVDTFDKGGGSLLKHWPLQKLRAWVESIHGLSMCSAIAGSLSHEIFDDVLDAQPDVVAVRGAACHGKRTGRIDREQVRSLKSRLLRRGATAGLGAGPE